MNKKLIFGCLASMAFSLSALAQGQINFFTFNANTALGQVYLPGTTMSVDGAFSGQLSVSSSIGGVYSVVGAVGDFVVSGVDSAINAGNVTVPGFAAGATVFYKLLVWNDAAGGSFDTASVNPIGIVGMSAPQSIVLGGGGPPPLPTFPANSFPSFALTAVPEPSVIALGILGAAAVIFRRRKS